MKRKILYMVIALVLMVALVPTAVFAADVTGNVTSNNNAPEALSLTISNMTPQLAHTLTITVTDDNTLADIAQIDIWIFYDADAGDNGVGTGTWDSDEEAVYKWEDGGAGWTMEDGGLNPATDHTWAIGAGSTPTMTDTTGTWTLDFTPGKLAAESDGTASEWDVYVKVYDLAAASVDTTTYSLLMAAYSSIATDVGSITFGGAGINLGTTTYITTPGDYNFATQVLANDAYALQSNTTATWTTGSVTIALNASGTAGATGEFGLNIDDAGTSSSLTTPQPVTTSAANITDHTTDARVATTDGAVEATADQDFYMSLGLSAAGIPVGTYTGTITLTVVN